MSGLDALRAFGDLVILVGSLTPVALAVAVLRGGLRGWSEREGLKREISGFE